MPITIYDKVGNPKVELSPNDSSTQATEIQGDNVLTLSFTHYEHIDLDVDDYADFEGERYWLTEKYRPKQKSTKEWSYDIKLYGVESMIKRLLVIKTVDNEDEPVFTLTAPPCEHAAMIVRCMNTGMGNISDWKVGRIDGTENIVIDYFGKYCDEALKEIAEKVGAEWWVEGQTVNVCKCEHGEPVELGYDKGLLSIDPGTADNVKFYTRLYPVGSTRNIDREKYGFSRLQLPGGRKYVEINADKYGRVDHFEQSAFEDIYPRRIGTVSSVRNEVRTGEDGKPFTIYYFTDNSLPFDPNDYMIGGLVIRVSFQEGSELAGLGDEDNGTYYFEVNFNSSTREFEIITIWPYDNDMQLPGNKIVPKEGDKYILWNLRMPDEYYDLAEKEFLAAVNKYNADHSRDVSVYKAPTDHVWIEDNNVELTIGRRVRLISDKYFPGTGFRDSRITKITRKVNLPTSMDLEISDVLSRTSQQKITDSIDDVRNYVTSLDTSLPDIIRTGDGTRPTDNNLFSALRSLTQFIRKDKSDRTPYSLAIGGRATAEAGMQFGLTYIPGLVGGMGGWIGPDGAGELRSLILWSSLEVPELRFNRVEILQGVDWHATGGGIVESCEGDTVTLKLEEGDYGAVAEDDLCLGIWHFARPTDKARCNLVKDTATPQTAASSGPTDNFRFVRYKFDVPVDFKAGDSFVLSLENVERLAGTATEFHARLYDMDGSQSVRMISSLVKFNAADRTCVLTVVNPSSSSTVELLLYAGLSGETAGNSVRFTRPMLVRGETPAEWNYAESEFDGLNAEADSDDIETGKGLFRFSGFATMYFRIKAVSGDNNGTATIQMREGYEHLRPQPGMHFVAFGNRTRKDRQTCRYATRTYERLMKDVDDWTFRPDNIKLQFGDLSNLTIDGLTMSGYSAYLNNVYFDGVLRQLENSPLRLTYETYGDKYVGDNDDCMIRLTALKGVEDVTDSVTWAVSASTGAATPSVTPEGTLTLGKSVLGGGEEATVTVTATWRKTPDAAPKTASAIIIIRDNALLKGETGSSYTPNLLKGTKTWNTAVWGYGSGMGSGSEPDGEMNGFTVLHGNFEGHGTQAYIELAQQFFPVVKGQTYTLSFWAKGTGNMRTFCYPAVNGFLLPGGTGDRSNITLSDTEQVYQLTTDWKRHRVSFRVDGTPVPENTRILFRVPAGNDAWIAGAKLEIGANNNPEWSPNDEDLKGATGKDGEDAISIQVSPRTIVAREGETTVTNVYVDLYRGTRRIPYNDPDDGNMVCSTLTQGGSGDIAEGVHWSFRVDADGRFYYRIGVASTASGVSLDVPFTVEYNGVKYPQTFSVRTIANGEPGASITGPQGPVVRIRGLFEDGYYYDGTEAVYEKGVPVYWLDIVWTEDTSGNRYYKRCVDSGYYDSSNGPHPSDNETATGWADFSQLDNLIVDLLIAKSAYIKFLNGQEIVFGETVNKKNIIWGRVGAPKDGVIMWAGGADTGTATYLLDKNGRARFGKTSDNHIVIDPDAKQITVRDSSGRKKITIDGEAHTLESSYGVTDNLDMGKLEGASTSSSATYTVGTIAFGESGGSLKLTLSAWLQVQSVQYKQTGAGGQEIIQYARATSTVKMRLLKNGVEQSAASGSIASASLNSGLYETPDNRTYDLSAEWTGLAAGTYTVQVVVTITRDTGTDISGNKVTAKAYARLSHAVKAVGVPESYRAFMCGNALVSANSMLDYFRAAKTSSGYMTEASAGDYGVRVSDDGLAAKDSNGAWNAVLVTCEKQAADANKCVLEQLGSRMYTTNADTVNLPTGAGTYYGAITTTTLNATAGHHIQEWKSFSQPVQCYTRRCMNNTWGAWTKNY